jgi:CBS domain-containing protein
MKAADIMSSPAVTVTPDTTVHELAALLAGRGISAVPVVDNDSLAGIVSEADLLCRHEIGTDCALLGEPWWLRIFRKDSSASDYVRSHAVRVRDIMTRDVLTARPDTPLSSIAAMFEKHRVKRLPVVEAGRLFGIVSRSDLVSALSTAAKSTAKGGSPDDEEIKAALLKELGNQPWWRSDLSVVDVERGVVTYRGLIDSGDERAAARVAAEGIQGVRDVQDERSMFQDMPSGWV